MNKKEFLELVKRIRDGQESHKDILLYNTWFEKFQTSDVWDTAEQGDLEDIKQDIHNRICEQIDGHPKNTKNTRLLLSLSVAAIILIALTAGLYSIYYKPVATPQTAQNHLHSIISGHNKAMLTLSNGRQVVLNEMTNGQVAMDGNMTIQNTADGSIIYQNISTKTGLTTKATTYNVLTTPNSGQYRVKLADGSIAFLDAASSLRYPTAFKANERVVELNGKAYFEIAHNAAKPFKVVSKGQVVEVLGTHFNINAYGNEASVKTTLLEGSIRVIAGGKTAILKPGQQLTFNGNKSFLTATDVEEAVAWKDGYLEFADQDIRSVMREISRWFDVKVDFESSVGTVEYTARISKYTELKEVLKVLESTKTVHFKIQGRRIMVRQ